MIVAMWSGPRNLSTAMMRSFGGRSDFSVIDEPYYAAYLARTELDHPLADKVIEAGETDPARVGALCLREPGAGRVHVYQKHMTHHMLGGFDRSWIGKVKNAFLIRDPRSVIASYQARRESPQFEELGFAQQVEIFDLVADRLGGAPPVIDADQIRRDPAAILDRLCRRLGVAFDPAMLAWAPGPRPEDGIWAAHWYQSLYRSTGFAPPEEKPLPRLEGNLAQLADKALPIYHRLRSYI